MTQNELRAAVDGVMSHQWSNTQEAMTALTVLVDEAHKASDEIERLTAQRDAGLSIAAIASAAAHKLLREDAFLPHAEVEWLLESLPKIDAWLAANGCIGISDFKLQAVDEALAAYREITK
jgi:hypothetical protein